MAKKNMNLNDIRKIFYFLAKILGDINAIKRGKVGKRVQRRVAGKMASRTLWGKLFK